MPLQNKINEFTTNSFAENPMGTIALATACGMGLMFMSITLGMPIVVSMVMLIGGILLVYGWSIGKVTYTMYEDGFTQTIRRFIPYRLWGRTSEREIVWSDIVSYKSDVDATRSMKEYEFIKLRLRKSPHSIWITDQHDKDGFGTFRDSFVEQVAKYNEAFTAEKKLEEPMRRETSMSQKKPVVVKKSFYARPIAKLVAVVLVIVMVSLVAFSVRYGIGVTSTFKLLLIVVPGTFYVLYRVKRAR